MKEKRSGTIFKEETGAVYGNGAGVIRRPPVNKPAGSRMLSKPLARPSCKRRNFSSEVYVPLKTKTFGIINSYMKVRSAFTCPLELVHDMIKGKWKPIVLWRLRMGATSLSKLQKDIEGINQKMLIEQLKELMEDGFVGKTVYPGYPLKVEYYLTERRGKAILKALVIMQDIGINYMISVGKTDILMAKGIIPE